MIGLLYRRRDAAQFGLVCIAGASGVREQEFGLDRMFVFGQI
jgi:hypothetical protein